MAKQLTENQLTQIVSESVNKVLKEWSDSIMPGISKNPKVAAAQEKARTSMVGKPITNTSTWEYEKKSDGGYDKVLDSYHTVYKMLSTIEFSKNEERIREAGEKFAMFLHNNEEAMEKVRNALSDITYAHQRDYGKWNPKEIAESKKK